MNLTAKQARFVDEYLIDLNATQAAIRAGYSKHTARAIGSELLTNVNIAAAIDEAKLNRSERTGIDAAWVLERLRAEAEADIRDIYGERGELLPVDEWPLIWRQGLIVGIDSEEIIEDGAEGVKAVSIVRKIKQADRTRRLELIGKHVNVQAFKDQLEVSGLDKLAERVARAKARKAQDAG